MMTRRPPVAPDPAALARSEHDTLSVPPSRRRHKPLMVTLWRRWFGRKRHKP